MNSDPSSHATGWPASQNVGHAPALQHMRVCSIHTPEVTTNETQSASQPARKMKTPLPSSPVHKLQNAQLVRPANVMDIANLMNPVVDREVDMTMETDYQPEDSVPLTEAVSAPISQPFKEASISNTATLKQRLPCPRCGKSFGSSWGLQLHLDIFHPKLKPLKGTSISGAATPKQRLLCPRCSKTFASPSGVHYHIKSFHLELKPFNCKVIGYGKTFAQASHLTRHTNTVHLGLRSSPCPVCSKAFTSTGNRNKHMRSKICKSPSKEANAEE
ncbi:hypothetical protein L207DRAFT_584236 [Hyaloscypha variabilis F]|uniref:C2H2-type domain-containing protein n=1 Tax=Hyaloscypha variabilis (strain UAMH 11265 / GT02V1 / F) TaxID=1149755 RepID=A0A2J6RJY7_HYAVF|nr:hypothetical protein L207DRAFT_584236 [Hyaloscypha variabilis F]